MILRKEVKKIIAVVLIIFGLYVSDTLGPSKNSVDGFTEVKVVRVVDGDTVVIAFNGTTTKARLIGVDTLESVDPRRPVECYSVEAKEYMGQLLSNPTVYIETDKTQGVYDKYGRILVYMYTSTTTPSVNELLIKNGYAKEYTYDKAYKYMNLFRESERRAQKNALGMWNSEACVR